FPHTPPPRPQPPTPPLHDALPISTYIFAHARTGMFLPLLEGSKVDNGKKMKGMLVQVYTSDDQLFLYSISEVRRHVLSLDAAFKDRKSTPLNSSHVAISYAVFCLK